MNINLTPAGVKKSLSFCCELPVSFLRVSWEKPESNLGVSWDRVWRLPESNLGEAWEKPESFL
jgi:hypothetical protein